MNIPKGLEGVEVDTSAVSLVDGERGQLSYRGIDIRQLAEQSFTDVALRVLDIDVPDFPQALAAAGKLTDREQALIELTSHAHPMQVLQALVPVLDYDGDHFAEFPEAAPGLIAAAKLPQIIAQLSRGARVAYPSTVDYCTRFLEQIDPTLNERSRRAFSITQVLQIEHSFNAGTFTARVVASTLAPIQNSIAAALGALHGKLHGGADQAALETADRVGNANRANAFVDRCLETGEKVMGMGHREYRVLDPRARYVKTLAEELSRGTEHEATYETLAAIETRFNERMAEKGKALYANLEFYKGLIYRVLGFRPDLFTVLFAMARVFGYVAHFMESRLDNRLIRPAARYTGPRPTNEPVGETTPASA